MDEDLQGKQAKELATEVLRLRTQIRKHRDQRGDDRCWLDDLELYSILPEKTKADLTLPPREKFLKSCARFWESRQENPGLKEPAAEETAQAIRLLQENALPKEDLARALSEFVVGKGMYFEADSYIKHAARRARK
ncbi:MAG TPA: hypothetical protein VJI67_01285 [archaeon]|nr:hypothetical protein [archaeon]HLD81151.1 hypothetical protein [archaeon]